MAPPTAGPIMTPRFFDEEDAEEAGAEVTVDEAGAAVATLEEVTRVLEPPAFSVMTDIRVDMLGPFEFAGDVLALLGLAVPVFDVIDREVGLALAGDETALEEGLLDEGGDEGADEDGDEDVGAAEEELDFAGLIG